MIWAVWIAIVKIKKKKKPSKLYPKHTDVYWFGMSGKNAGDSSAIDFTLKFDWLNEWREFSGPITKSVEDKLMQTALLWTLNLVLFFLHDTELPIINSVGFCLQHCEEIIQSFYFAWCLLQLKWEKKSTEDNRLSRDISRHCNCWRDLWFRILFGWSVVKPKPKFITTTNQHFSF